MIQILHRPVPKALKRYFVDNRNPDFDSFAINSPIIDGCGGSSKPTALNREDPY